MEAAVLIFGLAYTAVIGLVAARRIDRFIDANFDENFNENFKEQCDENCDKICDKTGARQE